MIRFVLQDGFDKLGCVDMNYAKETQYLKFRRFPHISTNIAILFYMNRKVKNRHNYMELYRNSND